MPDRVDCRHFTDLPILSSSAWSALIFIGVVGVCIVPPVQRMLARGARLAARVSRRGWVSICVIFIISLISMALPALLGNWPVPAIHDEFGYLLAADTFAHGRVTNQTHKHWRHFETFHVIHEPTYMSKFPPGQGLALAVGQVLFARPIVGAWLSVAGACAAVAWMLRVWVPARWALLGGIIAALHVVVHWWSQTYWGGGVAFLGGAMLGGGAARIMRQPRATSAAIMALGMTILANSRPFEGLLVTIPLLLVLAFVVAHAHGLGALLRRVIIPCIAVLAPLAAAMLYYNWRITHDPLTMPYTLHQKQYMIAPLMHWQQPNPIPQYRHDLLRRFHLYDELPVYEKQRTLRGFLDTAREKLASLARWYLRPWPIVIPLIAALLTLRRRPNWLALLVCIWLPVMHILLSPWMRNQYMAPAMPFFVALVVVGLHRLEALRIGAVHFGSALVAAVLLAHALIGVLFMIDYNRRPAPAPGPQRAQFVEFLHRQPSRHLAIVRYTAHHSPAEWVYNHADIDSSRIVFAREMNPQGDQPLLDYFKDRTVWIIDVDGPQAYVRPLERD